MDQRPDQLNDESWYEDRTTRPRVEDQAMVADTVSDYDSEAERIKADIKDTRADLGQTLNEIQERLSPEHVMDQVKETVREATIGKVEKVMERVNDTISNVTEPAMEVMGRAGEKLKETGSAVTNTVRRNPIPLALIGLGLGMFIVNRVRNADDPTMRSRTYEPDFEPGYGMSTPQYRGMGRQYGDRSGEYAGMSRQYGMSNRSTLGQMKETANDFAHGTAERVSHLGHQAKEGAMWAGRGFQRMLHENPLAVGATAIAVGAAVGLALPTTRVEQEYMGEASERLVDKAQQVARDAMDKVKSATQGEGGGGQGAGQSQPGQQSQQSQQFKQGQSQQGQSQHGQPQHGHTPQGQSQAAGQSQQGQSQQGQSQQGQSQQGQSQQGQSQQGQSRPGQSQPGRPNPTV
ncbi:MAG: DUF3618 domain-containing protein [Acidobacteria bacterium]|nr:DUF3618 domain-containing protein [Acidobacteriota bacterium]